MLSSGLAEPFARDAFRVLVVEDDLEVCALIEDALVDSGYEVECVQSDAAAYQALERAPRGYAALIADINLREGTTGFDVARFARRRHACLPVIYVTGAASRSDAAHAVVDGVFLFKPFSAEELVQSLREQLER